MRNDSGVRLGATVIARYDFGKTWVSSSFGWTGATAASASNPAGTADASVQWERSTSLPS